MTPLCAVLSVKKAKNFSLRWLKTKELDGKEGREKEIKACQIKYLSKYV